MNFETIEQVPAPIAEYYTTEVVSEPTGNMIEEEYTYLDDDNVEQTGTRQVPEYADVTYVVLIDFGETKSWTDVSRVVSLRKPKDVIDTFIACAIAGDKKAFHDAYIAWLDECVEVDAYNTSRVEDEEGMLSPIRPYPQEPVYVATDAEQYLLKAAKDDRDMGRYAPITVDGLTYDATQEAYDNLQGVVSSWEIMIADQTLIDAGMVVDGEMYWTLADNSNALVTKAMLETVVTAIRVRAGLLHAQYQAEKSAMEA